MQRSISRLFPRAGSLFLVCFCALLSVANGRLYAQKGNLDVQVRFCAGPKKAYQIPYSRTRLLTVDDFKGHYPPQNRFAAQTYSRIDITTSFQERGKERKLEVELCLHFDPLLSWMKPEGRTPAILAHEQLHWDITAIKACELAEAIRHIDPAHKDPVAEVGKLYRAIMKELEEQQARYDSETGHSVVKEAQERWEASITEQAKALTCYP